MEKVFDYKKFAILVAKWKKHLALILVGSAVVSAIASSPIFIKPKYKSTVVVYPTNAKSYGTETPIEQMLQMFEANDIRSAIIGQIGMYRVAALRLRNLSEVLDGINEKNNARASLQQGSQVRFAPSSTA